MHWKIMWVVINDTTSVASQVKWGVPQGYVVESLLFLVCVDALRLYLPGTSLLQHL